MITLLSVDFHTFLCSSSVPLFSNSTLKATHTALRKCKQESEDGVQILRMSRSACHVIQPRAEHQFSPDLMEVAKPGAFWKHKTRARDLK